MLDNFAEWLKLQETGVDDLFMPNNPPQDRMPHNVVAGKGDGLDYNNPMRRKSNPTSAFPTYGGEPLPGNKRAKMKKN